MAERIHQGYTILFVFFIFCGADLDAVACLPWGYSANKQLVHDEYEKQLVEEYARLCADVRAAQRPLPPVLWEEVFGYLEGNICVSTVKVKKERFKRVRQIVGFSFEKNVILNILLTDNTFFRFHVPSQTILSCGKKSDHSPTLFERLYHPSNALVVDESLVTKYDAKRGGYHAYAEIFERRVHSIDQITKTAREGYFFPPTDFRTSLWVYRDQGAELRSILAAHDACVV